MNVVVCVKQIPDPAKHDRIKTPWGVMQFFGPPPKRWGNGGWLLARCYNRPILPHLGKLVPGPDGAAPATPATTLTLVEAQNGKAFSCLTGDTVEVRLRGNATTGFRWIPGKLTGVLQAVGSKYVGAPAGVMGGGGVFVITFKVVKAGAEKLTLQYRRPWEKRVARVWLCLLRRVRRKTKNKKTMMRKAKLKPKRLTPTPKSRRQNLPN